MKPFHLLLSLLLTFFICLSACSGGEEPIPPTPKPEEVKTEITIDSGIISNGLSFSDAGGEQSISFTTNENWTLSVVSTTSGATWCTASATSGAKGIASVKFTVTENTSYDNRSVSVTIKAGTVTKTFTISQKGVDALLVTTDKYEVAQEGGSISIEVKANIDYKMEISEDAKDWIKESSSRALTAYKHTLSISANEEVEKREGEIHFKSGDKVETVKVYQAGGAILLLSQNEYNVSDKGDTISVDIKSNFEFGVQMPDVDWIVDEASSRGLSSHTLKYVIKANEEYDSRSSAIVFYDKNSELKDTITIYQQGVVFETDYVDLKLEDPNVTTAYDETNGSLTITYTSGNIPKVKTGNSIVLPAEYGFDIRVIESLSISGNTLTLNTSKGNMSNLFRNISFTLTTDAEVASRSANSNVYTPVAYGYIDEKGIYHEMYNESRAVYPIENFKWEAKLDFNGEKLYEGKAGTLSWKKCEFAAGLKGTFTFDFGEKTIDEVRTVGDLKRIDYKLTGNVDMDMLLHYKYEYEYKESDDDIIKYNVIPMGHYTFEVPIGGVFVPVHLQIYTHLGRMYACQIEGELDATAGVMMGNELTVGLEWTPEGGAKPIREAKPYFEYHPLTVEAEASAEAKVSYYPQWEIGIYGFKAIWLEPRPYLKEKVEAGFRASTDGENHIGWKAETYNGMDIRMGLETEFGFWRKDIWISDIINIIEDRLLFEAPSRITTLSPDNNIEVKKGESVTAEFLVESFSQITNKYYPCPFALINFERECGELDKEFVITDAEGKASVVWTPDSQDNNSVEARVSKMVSKKLTAKVVDKEGKAIDDANLFVKIEDPEYELREALIKLYKSTDGDNWTNNENWCSDKPVTEWCGISIKDNKYTINLSGNNLVGEINQAFPENVGVFTCGGDNKLTSINVAGSVGLIELGANGFSMSRPFSDNKYLVSVNVSNCTSLEYLNLDHNEQLTSLDISGCIAFPILRQIHNINGCAITSLNASGCIALEWLSCSSSKLEFLDITGCNKLWSLTCRSSKLSSLDVSGSKSLVQLMCGGKGLVSLDVSECTSLTYLDFSDSKNLKSVNASGCTALTDWYWSSINESYNINSLDLSGCTSLTYLHICDGVLISLDVSGCTALETLQCGNNQLTSLNVSGCAALKSLSCRGNQLSSMDVSSCTALKSLNCGSNQLSTLDVSRCTSLTHLWCWNNQITSVIPEWFSQFIAFGHDERFEYYYYAEEGQEKYKDNGKGWWYSGEPQKGYHRPD